MSSDATETETVTVGDVAADAAPSLTDEQRARVTAKLMDLARGVSKFAPMAKMKDEGPHSSHADNDGWL